MGRRYSSQFKPKKHHVSLERWDKQEKIEKKIQESDDSYEDHYKIYWRFAQKRKTSKSTDSIPTKKNQYNLHSFEFQQKKSIKWAFDSHQDSKVRLWNITPT